MVSIRRSDRGNAPTYLDEPARTRHITPRDMRLYLSSSISCALPCAVADALVGCDAVRGTQFVTEIES